MGIWFEREKVLTYFPSDNLPVVMLQVLISRAKKLRIL